MSSDSPAQPSTPAHNIDFEEIEHTADWALRVRGQDLRELLTNAARGMVSLVVAEAGAIPTDVEQHLDIEAIDAEGLLVDWLSELAYWAEAELLIFHQFDLQNVTPTSLEATVRGGHVPNLKKHIKAVTYHQINVEKGAKGWQAQVIFDV